MKKLYILALASLLIAACAEDIETNGISKELITFNVSDNGYLPEPEVDTRSTTASPFEESQEFISQCNLFNESASQETKSNATTTQTPIESDFEEELMLTTTVEKGIRLPKSKKSVTRGSKVTSLSGTFHFGVTEYKYSSSAEATSATFTNVKPSFDSGSKFHSGKTWESDANTSGITYNFYAYYPHTDVTSTGVTLAENGKSVTYTVPNALANQPDLMTAYVQSPYTSSGVNLTFGHRLAAVKIKLGDSWVANYKITGVTFNGVNISGTLSLTNGSWSSLSGSGTAFTPTGITQATAANADVAAFLMMIPQSVSSATMTVTLTDNATTTHTITTTLSGSWTAGTTTTYTISPAGISTFTVKYPHTNYNTAWVSGSTQVQGPVSDYTNTSDVFGLYAVDKNGNIVFSNLQCPAKSVNTTNHTAELDLSSHSGKFFSSQYTYYLYYPYKASPGSVTASATDADTFFANVIRNWTVEADQSSGIGSSDLQVAKLVSSSFSMKHKMGLATITMLTQSSVTTNRYYLSTDNSYTWTHGTSTVTSSSTYSSTAKPYMPGTTHYYVTQAGVETSFAASSSQTGFNSTLVAINNSWSGNITISSGAASALSFTIPSFSYISNNSYTLAVKDVFYSNGAISKPTSLYSGLQPIGIVGYVGNDNVSEKNFFTAKSRQAHGLVVALKKAAKGNYWCASAYVNSDVNAIPNLTTAAQATTASYLSGYNFTQAAKTYIMPKAALDYGNTVANRAPTTTTGWFLPSVGQWYYVSKQMLDVNKSFDFVTLSNVGNTIGKFNNALAVVGDGNYEACDGWHWTSSESGSSTPLTIVDCILGTNDISFLKPAKYYASSQGTCRAFLAF